MANQSRPDEDYVIAAVHVEAEVRAILEDTLRSLSVTINMIAGVPFQWLTITHRLQLKNNRVMLGDRIVVSQRYRCRRDAARTKVQSLLCCFAPRKNPGTECRLIMLEWSMDSFTCTSWTSFQKFPATHHHRYCHNRITSRDVRSLWKSAMERKSSATFSSGSAEATDLHTCYIYSTIQWTD